MRSAAAGRTGSPAASANTRSASSRTAACSHAPRILERRAQAVQMQRSIVHAEPRVLERVVEVRDRAVKPREHAAGFGGLRGRGNRVPGDAFDVRQRSPDRAVAACTQSAPPTARPIRGVTRPRAAICAVTTSMSR